LFKISGKNNEEIYDFVMIIMKKNRLLKFAKNNSLLEIIEQKEQIKYSLFDLF